MFSLLGFHALGYKANSPRNYHFGNQKYGFRVFSALVGPTTDQTQTKSRSLENRTTWYQRDYPWISGRTPANNFQTVHGLLAPGGGKETPHGPGDHYTPQAHLSLLSNGPAAAQMSPLAVKGRSDSYPLGNDLVTEVSLPGQ